MTLAVVIVLVLVLVLVLVEARRRERRRAQSERIRAAMIVLRAGGSDALAARILEAGDGLTFADDVATLRAVIAELAQRGSVEP